MALRLLSTRLLTSNLPLRVTVASNASMSTSTKGRKRESIRSMLASVFGGYVDPANPNDPPIPADKVNFPDTTEQATGEEKLLLLAFENGVLDPFCNLPIERTGDMGTKDKPLKIESFEDERLVGCVCEPSQTYVKYTKVYRGEPRRCHCGHWMELVEAPKFWQKIPREDLLTIPFFKDMEEQGKLDKLLSGELEHEADHHGHH